MGSSLYQAGSYEGAYEAFKATYDGYALLVENNVTTTFDTLEHNKALYYSAVCAQQAGKMDIAVGIYSQLIEMDIA